MRPFFRINVGAFVKGAHAPPRRRQMLRKVKYFAPYFPARGATNDLRASDRRGLSRATSSKKYERMCYFFHQLGELERNRAGKKRRDFSGFCEASSAVAPGDERLGDFFFGWKDL